MPLPFEFEGRKGVVLLQDLVVPYANPLVHFKKRKKEDFFIINNNNKEPTSVLDSINTTPSPPASTSTLSSSLAAGDSLSGVAALSSNSKWPPPPENQETPKWPPPENQETSKWPPPENQETSKWPPPENQETSTSNPAGAGVLDLHHFHQQPTQCGGPMEDWDTSGGDSGQDQAMLRWIMGDVEDPSIGFNKVLHGSAAVHGAGGGSSEFEFSGGFGVVDQGFSISGNQIVNPQLPPPPSPPPAPPHTAAMFQNHHQNQIFSPVIETHLVPFDIKPNLFNNPQLLINQSHHHHHPPFEHQLLMAPQPKRHNPNPNPNPFLDSGQTHQGIIDELFKAADLIQSGNNPIFAQGILARLNHQLSPIGNPFYRAAFYFKEVLQLLLNSILNNNNINPQITLSSSHNSSPFSLIFKIGAYKSFSEISPFLQFANFTCNQALLESLNGFDRIHIIDFDIGYGGQWASLMQELALRNNGNGISSLKITAFASPSTHDPVELGLTRENLTHFAKEINIGFFDFEIVNVDVLASSSFSLPFHVSENEAVAVNLPVSVFSNHQSQIPSVLRFVKNLGPKIVVSVDRGCDRTDLPFSNHVIHALQSYSNLLESLDAVNMNLDSLQKIERFLVQPAIEKIVLGRFLFPEKTQHWRTLFLSAGFTPLSFSNFTESQAECLVKRTPVRDFHVEKRQSLLVLCWQRRELVSASAWRC